MEFAKNMLLKVIGLVPINFLIGLVLDMIEDWTKKTKNKVDDAVIAFLRTLVNEVEFSTDGIKVTKSNKHLFGDISVDSGIKALIEYLKKMAKSTETDIDDAIVAAVEAALKQWKLIK